MRGESYICWRVGCRNTDPLLQSSRGLPPQDLKDDEAKQTMLDLMLPRPNIKERK